MDSGIHAESKAHQNSSVARDDLSYAFAGGKTGVLMIHGFSGHNAELRECAEYLASQGFAVSVPMLAGHGTKPEELIATTPYDWLDTSTRAFVNLSEQCDRVFLVGVSIGANIAFKLAHLFDVAGVVSLGGVIQFFQHRALRTFLPVVAPFRQYHQKKVIKSHFFQDSALERRKAYPVVPLKTLHLVVKFIEAETKQDLPRVTVPALVMHSSADKAVKPQSAKYIYAHIGSAHKELVFIDRSHHNLLIDEPRQKVFERIAQFIRNNETPRV